MTDSKPSQPDEPLLIGSKLHRPRTPSRLVERRQLLERLDAAARGALTVISAGPGFGKTTLAAQWLEQRAIRSSWLSLDRLDSDPDRFSRYFVQALQAVLPDPLARTQALLRARTSPPWPHFIEVLASELGPPAEPSIVVLEDYHSFASRNVDDLLERTIEVLPERLHLLVLTRADPAWPLGRWRARGRLAELRSRDLRFSIDETRAFFELHADLQLADADVEMLHRRAEGWIAGLRLAAVSMAGTAHSGKRVRRLSGTDRNIADFLMEDVVAGESPEVREFLAVAASFDRFCAPLCDHVLDPARSSSEILAGLESRNLFVVPLDEDRKWYRFHHLFQELLVERSNELASPELCARVDARAAAWFAQHGMVDEALQHWIAAGDLDSAAALVGERVDTIVRADFSRRSLSRWLAMFPPGAELGRLPLLVAHACQRIIHWDLSGVADRIEQAAPLSAAKGGRFRANLEALRAFLHFWHGDAKSALRSARIALADRPRVTGLTWSLATIYAAGGMAMQGRKAEAHQLLDEAITEGARHQIFGAEFIGAQAILHFYAQEYDAVRQRALQLVASQDHDPSEYWLGYGCYLLGAVAYERNRLKEANEWFRRVEPLRYLVTSRVYQDALIGRALVARATGDRAGVESHTAQARSSAIEAGDDASLRISRSLELRFSTATADSPDSYAPPPANDHHSFSLEVPSVTWAARLIGDESPDTRGQALPFVEGALERMRRHHNDRQATVLSALRALALDAGGRREDALAGLAETLQRAEPHGLVRTFLDLGPRLKDLLDELSRTGGHDGYRETLRGAFLEEGRSRTTMPEGEPWNVLTYRELEVLELLAKRLTDKEIASQLSVTPGAIKKRTRNIYRKLDAGDRREAVARALARGILRNHP